MWLAILSDQLPVVALVGHYPANKLIGREPLHGATLRLLSSLGMPPSERMRYYPAVGPAIPRRRTSCSRVTHPSATEPELPRSRSTCMC